MENFNWAVVVWPMLGLLLVAMAVGILFGAIRGFKRSWIRLCFIAGTGIVALFLAPVTAGAFGSIRLPLDGDGRVTLEQWVTNMVSENDTLYSFMNNFGDAADFVFGIPFAILSLLSFIALFIILRIVTWIIYAILVRFVARRRRDATGNKVPLGKGSRWLGVLFGAITGLVVFLFLWMPMHGLVHTANRIDRYETPAHLHTVENVRELYNEFQPYEILHDANRAIQRSGYGFITRYTGIQGLSSAMFGHLTSVRMSGRSNINLTNDIVQATHLHRDFIVLNEQIDTDDIFGSLRDMDIRYYYLMQHMVDRAFEMGIVRLAVDQVGGVGNFIRETDLFSLNFFDTDEDNEDFNEALFASLALLNSDHVHNDLSRTIWALQNILNYQRYGYNMVDAFSGLFNYFGSEGQQTEFESAVATAQLFLGTAIVPYHQSAMHNALHNIFSMSIFTDIINETNPYAEVMVTLLLEHFLPFEAGEVEDITLRFDMVARDVTRILHNGAEALIAVNEIIIHDENFLTGIAEVDTARLDAVGLVLNDLTQNIGLASNMRTMVNRFITDHITEGFDNIDLGVELPVADALNDLLAVNVNWVYALRELQRVTRIALDIAAMFP